MLQRSCVECHGPDKAKGGLRVDSHAAVVKGGENGAAIVVGQSSKSVLVARMRLPPSHDEHMPPEAKPQPNAAEVDLVAWWIDRGASETLRVKDALVPEGARTILGRTVGSERSLGTTPDLRVPPPRAAASAPASDGDSGTQASGTTEETGAHRKAYGNVVASMLQASCVSCHGPAKQKGKLRVDSIALMQAGGKAGSGIIAGTTRGTILARMKLPLDADEHMPPRASPQPRPEEIANFETWVKLGASDTAPASQLPHPLVGPSRGAAAAAASGTQGRAAAPSIPPRTEGRASAGPGEVFLYRDVVAPILERRCGECHREPRDEGGLRITDLAAMIHDAEIIKGNPDESPLVRRMALPTSSAARMPPPERDPAEAWEKVAVATWIAGGATPDLIVATSTLPPELADALGDHAANVANGVTPRQAEAGSANTAPTTSPVADSRPNGTVVPPRAAGCGSCAFASKRAEVPAMTTTLIGAVAFAVRRRATRKR
jgi:cytochrome c553